MSAIEKTIENNNSTRRLTFRQKFWLLGVGVPVFFVIGFAIPVFLQKPLNPTEEKLLGKWEAVSPANTADLIVEFRHGDAISGSDPWLWKANKGYLSTTGRGQ